MLNVSPRIGALCAAALMGLAACGDGIDLPEPAQMEKVGNGDGQQATAGNRLALPLSVRVTAADGSEVPRANVRWTVTAGDGAVLSDSLTVTDGTGVAHVFLALGPAAGQYSVEASLVVKPDAVAAFSATAVPAPVLTGVTPGSFFADDDLVLQGAHLSDSVQIEIGGKLATVHPGSISEQSMTVVAPYCLVPGPVQIVARVGIAASSPITGTYAASSDPVNLAPGQYLSIEPEVMGGCASFGSAVGPSGPEEREYLMAVHSVTDTWGEILGFRFRGNTGVTAMELAEPAAREPTIADRFHDHLRQLEIELAQLPREPWVSDAPELVLASGDIELGDRRSFSVCDKVTCSTVEDFTPVEAEVKYVGTHALIYEDLEKPSGGFTAADYEEVGELFDSELYEVTTRAFGSESDIDRNGRVLILLSPVVNGLTDETECEESFITGFFFPIDIDPVYSGDQRSNQAEIFYSMVPDPTGSVTCEHSVDRVKRLVPITFVHELQHMINFSQHVIVRAGSSERTWLNEAMSHISEELSALHFEALGDDTRFSRFAINNLFNAYEYLKDPQQHFLMYQTGSGTIEERGAGWLFLRWLADQFGDGTLRRLSETDLVGTENVVAAVGEPMARVLGDWFLANYVSGNPQLAQSPERLSYQTWDFWTLYESLSGQDPDLFPRPFPLEPPVFNGGDFNVIGMLRSGSGAYFIVRQSPGGQGFAVELLDALGAPLAGAAEPVLSVVRIR
jgi:hypothetical protein